MRKWFRLLLLLLLPVITGCWSYQEVDQRLIVAGVAIDYDQDIREYRLTVEAVNQAATRGFEGEYFQARGKTVFDAIRNMIKSSDRKLYWSHLTIMVINEQIARTGLIPVIDMLFRGYEVRYRPKVLIYQGTSAAEVFAVVPNKAEPILSFNINLILKGENTTPLFHQVELWQFVKAMMAEGIEPTLPLIQVKKVGQEPKDTVSGTAVFKHDKMVGTLGALETKYFLMVTNQLQGGLLVVNANPVDQEKILVTLEILETETKVQPVYANQKLTMQIKVATVVNIAEIDGVKDIINKNGRMVFRKIAQEQIKQRVETIIRKVQQEYQSDIFGFGAIVRRKLPKIWQKLRPEWEAEFSKLKCEVEVELIFRGSALLMKPIQIVN